MARRRLIRFKRPWDPIIRIPGNLPRFTAPDLLPSTPLPLLVIENPLQLRYPFPARMSHPDPHPTHAGTNHRSPAAAALVLLLCGSGCAPPQPDTFQGYLEADYVYAAAPLAGTLQTLAVARGQTVDTASPLFTLEHEAELAAQREAEHRVTQARATLENLRKGRRPSEIASLEAQLQQARQSLKLAQAELDRRIELLDTKVIAPEEFDRAETQRNLDQARVDQLLADIETAQLGARPDEIRAAEIELDALTAALDRARWAVDQKQINAPTKGIIHDTLYRPGEWVAAGAPVVVLLPPANLKVRFFVPQNRLPGLEPGQTVSVQADGAPQPYQATISFLSTQAEFTPPVIFSRETRSKLIYLVEAVFPSDVSQQLRPGQPVEVRSKK
jgi:HlyD family secretion protein